MNSAVIDQITDFRNNVSSKLSNRDIVSFKLTDMDFDGDINVNGNIVTKKAMNKILTSLRVRDTFLNYKKDMQIEDWHAIQNILRNANQNVEFWGKRMVGGDGMSRITELYQRNEIIGDRSNFQENFNRYFDMVISALGDTNVAFNWKSGGFDPENERVDLKLLTSQSEIDLFKDGSDIWKTGVNLSWDLLKFSDAPFFERLICTNGMVAESQGFRANIQNKKFNLDKIQKEINGIIIGTHDKFEQSLLNASGHLKDTNVSLNEFYDFRNFFASRNNDHQYDHILGKVFNETDILRNYAVNTVEKSAKWLSTADSGRNAYDFINDMTYIASHASKVRVDENHARELQIKSSTMFFKTQLDLEDVAPGMKFQVNKIFQDN